METGLAGPEEGCPGNHQGGYRRGAGLGHQGILLEILHREENTSGGRRNTWKPALMKFTTNVKGQPLAVTPSKTTFSDKAAIAIH
jgi:hypothetical protein